MSKRSTGGATTEDGAGDGAGGDGAPAAGRRVLRMLGRPSGLLRWTSLRLRLVVVFALVALTAAVSASGIAYWLNRNTVLDRTQNAVLKDFRKALEDNTRSLPLHPRCAELQDAARQMAAGPQNYTVLLIGVDREGKDCAATTDKDLLTLENVPVQLRHAVNEVRPVDESNRYAHHLYWQRKQVEDTPYLVAGAKVIGGGPTGYMMKSLAAERQDLTSLAWSLGIATALALVGSALLAQAAATTVLRPVQRLGHAARQLGEGRLDTRLRVTGTDELADLSRTFNRTAERLEHRVEELSGREAASRRFVADMSHELRTPLTAITAVSEVLEEEADSLDPMIAPAVQLVVSETRRLNDLVENLMEVTRFDAGTARLVLDDVDVADQVTACIDARAWLDAVELDADRGIVVRLDPRRLDVILANLIGNALKHGGSPVRVSVSTEGPASDGGGRTGSTAVSAGGGPGGAGGPGGSGGPDSSGRSGGAAEADVASGPAAGTEDGGPQRSGEASGEGRPGSGKLVIRVRDHGPGIPEEVLPHVFDRFYKASASRPRSEGSGLGLSIALENAHIHGGEITAANLPEGGAVFTLRLPMDASPLTDDDRRNDDTADDEGTEGGR